MSIFSGYRNRKMRKCVFCRSAAIGPSGICVSCLDRLPKTPDNTRTIEGIDRLVAAFEYREPLRTLIHAFKDDKHRSAASFLARAMARLDDFPLDCVLVGVPLHEQRLKERGFCQTDELCAELSKLTGRQWIKTALERNRYTPPQTRLTSNERLHNLEDAFFAHGVKGLHIILVDDVVSTGATLRECALTLKAAGAAQVYALAACSAVRE